MFSLVISTKPLISTQKQLFEYQNKDRVISIEVDNIYSTFRRIDNSFEIIDSVVRILPNQSSYDESLIISKIIVNTENQTVQIHTTTRGLYYYNDGENLYCSTHISQLRKLGVPIEENTEVLPEFFIYRCVMPPETLYRGIKKTVFREKIIFEYTKNKVHIIDQALFTSTIPTCSNEFISNDSKMVENLLINSLEAIEHEKNASIVLLSGGLDSSILYQLSKKVISVKKSYSTSYPFMNMDSRGDIEKKYAISAAEALEAEHKHVEFTNEDYLNGLIESIYSAEEPLNHLQSVMLYLLFKKGIDNDDEYLIINGDGADVLFGLPTHNIIHSYENSMFLKLFCMVPFCKRISEYFSKIFSRDYSGATELMTNLKIHDIQNISHPLWKVGAYGSEQWVKKNFGIEENEIIKNRLNCIKKCGNRPLYDLIALNSLIITASSTCFVWDKLAEYNGKRLYLPFQNKKLIEYAFNIPWEQKLKAPKRILRDVAKSNSIPSFIISRRKSGFGVQPKTWALKGEIFDSLIPLCEKVFSRDELISMQSEESKKAMIFWNMLNYAIWKRLFIYNEPLSVLLEELQSPIVHE
jgi:asparagine synthetase B (glutamine-hydrolysing)